MSNPKKNFIYNIIYQVLILIIPLITAPYLARVVGVEGVGIYSYTYSIMYYFMLLTLLGVNNYGNRSIAKVRDDEKQLSKTFWEIFMLQFFMGIIMIIVYCCYVSMFAKQYRNISYIQLIFIISAMFDINWLFFGMEQFKKTIARNSIVKILTVILIVLFVKQRTDLWKYTLIMSGMTLVGQIILWTFVYKKISFVKVSFFDIKKHIKPNLILFIPVIAVSLYKMMDKIMLGSIVSVLDVGYYENAEKIVNIPLTFITALGTVMLPRISNDIANGKSDNIEYYINKSIKFVMFLSFAMCFGLISIATNFTVLYFGVEFKSSALLIKLLSITLPLLSFANVIRTQYLIPMEKDSIYIKSVICGAIINLILNILLIPIYGRVGACIGTISAEFVVLLYQAYSVKKEINIKKYINNSFPFFITSFIMFIIIFPISFLNINKILIIMLQIFIGVIIYLILNIKYLLSIINLKQILLKRKKKEGFE